MEVVLMAVASSSSAKYAPVLKVDVQQEVQSKRVTYGPVAFRL